MNELDQVGAVRCANCGTPMQGEFCHHCGQSIHSVLKPVHHMVEDTLDMVLHVDGRILHTLPPLLLKPGFLTLEYFSGRRVRYIAPFRLMFVLCLLAFAVCHLAIDADDVPRNAVVLSTPFDHADTPAAVQRALDAELAKVDSARAAPGTNPVAIAAAAAAQARLRTEAANRLAELAKANSTADTGKASRADTAGNDADADATDPLNSAWDARAYPVHLRWLPAFANRRLTQALEHMHSNIDALASGGEAGTLARERITAQLFASLPQALFLMLPLFALLLKLFYVFKRRLYVEHMIVALHSHAFLFLALLLGVGLLLLEGWLAGLAGWAARPVRLLEWALVIWAPTYLLLMQKRIYRQGWTMTIVKYLAVGWCYIWLLSTALLFGAVLSLSH
ncbi:DUF3667 domain-containing protein [Dyella ginsengisoli]|uniref:DUF3667 domain-containing protein n=1 Tax=Dyella ginsengisoli TaxID=363848 RepID=A0ABW8JNS6_9GAMM